MFAGPGTSLKALIVASCRPCFCLEVPVLACRVAVCACTRLDGGAVGLFRCLCIPGRRSDRARSSELVQMPAAVPRHSWDRCRSAPACPRRAVAALGGSESSAISFQKYFADNRAMSVFQCMQVIISLSDQAAEGAMNASFWVEPFRSSMVSAERSVQDSLDPTGAPQLASDVRGAVLPAITASNYAIMSSTGNNTY